MLQQYLRAIYNGFDTSRAVEPTMWREVLRVLNEATVSGLLQSKNSVPSVLGHRDSFLAALRHSNEVFAAFKVHSMSERMAARLLNPDGTLKPFRQWADDVKSISSHYVGAWLRTEYDTALIRAHNAADWQQFIRDADVMPNLRWMPTTSPTPESSHRAFWERKLTLPVSDPFWNEHHPGDRWNCKCSLEQTDDPATPELKAEFSGEAPQPGLTNNPGKDGHTFSQDHPYFPKSCTACPFNKGVKNKLQTVFRNEQKHCYNCSKINHAIQQPGVATAKSLVDNVEKDMIARKTACSFYSFSDREVAKIKQHGVELVSRDIFLSDQRILHALRDFKKNNGKSVSPDELKFFVENIASCSMYFDTEKANIIFATNQNGKVQKFVVEPNYKIKANGTKFTANAFITAGITQQYNLDEDKYIKIR
ncbi:phage head morphogenesis protein [Prevotella sp.]|uniref:phage head morphogenesis protein n=1 Tax=Prevotella sp. TaxID=59823 RepID=UPI002ABE5E12|nr:phage minor head protein [Prevotella sp.]